MTGNGRTYGFSYDPAGRLQEITATGIASRGYAWDGNDAIVTYANGAFLVRAVYGPGENEPLYQLDNQGRRTWFAQDERGSMVAGSNATGTAGAAIAYDEYGRSTSVTYQHGYSGALRLRDTGLYYMRARIYDPKLGRFLQPDPIGYGDGLNMYAYVGGDPVNATDLTGLKRLNETICRDYNDCEVNGVDYYSLKKAVAEYVNQLAEQSLQCGSNPNCTFGEPRSDGKSVPLTPLTGRDDQMVQFMLNTSVMKDRIADAWTSTILTGREHGFFIWYTAERGRFTFGPVREGREDRMGVPFYLEARQHYYHGDPFYAMYHTHVPRGYPTNGASVGDRNFLTEFPSVAIIHSDRGIIYGR